MAHADTKRSADRKYRDQLRAAARKIKRAPVVPLDVAALERELQAR